jgi:multiple sugar transport system substrate-binding protein
MVSSKTYIGRLFMKKKIVSLLTAVTLVASMLVGCGGNAKTENTTGASKAEKTADADVTTDAGAGGEVDVNEDGTVNNPESVKVEDGKLVFWSLFGGGDGAFMDKIIEDHNNGDSKMDVQSIMLVWADYYTKLQTAVAAGKGPDIGASHVSKLSELVEQGVVVPIDDYLDQLGVDLTKLYSPTSIDSVTFDGATYAIPLDTHAEILYANTDIMEKAGVTLNAEGQLDITNVDEFKAILDKIKAVIPDDGSTIAITNAGDDPYRLWWAVYFQMGGSGLVNDEGTEVTLDTETAIKAAEFVKSLYDDGYIKEGIDDHQAFFQSGKAGLCIGGTWATGAFEGTEGLKFEAQAFPQLFENAACWADSHSLIIPYNKERSEEETLAAVEFIVNVSGNGGAIWAKSGQIPSNLAVLESEEYKALPYRSGYKSELDKAVMPTKNANFYAMKAGIIGSLDGVWTGQVDAATAVDYIKSELETNLN